MRKGRKEDTRGEWASILLYFFELRLEAREAWLVFLEVAGRFTFRLPLVLLRRGLEDDEGCFLFGVREEADLRVAVAGRVGPRAMGLGRLRKNERRNQGCLASGLRGGRPALTRARSRILRSASSLCL